MRIATLLPVGILLINAACCIGQSSGAATTVADASATPPVPQLQERYPRYVIQRDDVVLLSFPLSPELNQIVTVGPDGYIDLMSAGGLHVQGMTTPQLIDALKKAYTGVLRDPVINVTLEDFQKPSFTVTGQVGKPGKYDLRSDITATEAIAVAGGLLPTAKTQVFLLHKASDEWYKVEKLDIKDVLNGKRKNEDVIIKPGDMVYVPESSITSFRKYVPYTVNAGAYVPLTP